ncbi:hypothetical protein [Methanobrevibacter sp.]|uniref:hypothetical protein n=1 Tax=Methanobrevibacter sp. TaxID=66852 RepID=UPI00386F06D0
MLEKKIDRLIYAIMPALFNAGEKAPTDYNEVYKIITNGLQVVKTIHELYVKNNAQYSIDNFICDFNAYCEHYNIPAYIMIDNVVLVRSIVQEIIK